jgi:carbon-monoxide dehydrogenase small subunit
MSDAREISLVVNGEPRTVFAFPMERLLDVLRRELGLTGSKEGCGEGECGACAVLVDGELVVSCLIPIAQAAGTTVVTIEGLADDARAGALRDAFIACGGAQCGICTPGMVLASVHLLERNPAPSREEIREALAGNLCRCTGYAQILEAVEQAASPGA